MPERADFRALDEVAGNDGNDGRRQPPQAGARALEEKGRRRMQEEQRQSTALRWREQKDGEEQDESKPQGKVGDQLHAARMAAQIKPEKGAGAGDQEIDGRQRMHQR